MSTRQRDADIFIALGCISAAIAVAAGAFGAHGLKNQLSEEMLAIYETAARYQMYHAFGLMVAGLTYARLHNAKIRFAGWSFVLGTILFSGSLYLLALTDTRWLGAVTPFGGAALIAGWLLIGFALLSRREPL